MVLNRLTIILALFTGFCLYGQNQLGNDIDGEAASDYSGRSVALSYNGKIVAIGANRNDGINGVDSGHVRVYEWNGLSWNKKGSDIDGEASDDESGMAISMSSSGNSIIIGSFDNDGNGNSSGHIRVYEWIDSSWIQKGSDIDVGTIIKSLSMSQDGNIIAVGNTNYNNSRGIVTIYE